MSFITSKHGEVWLPKGVVDDILKIGQSGIKTLNDLERDTLRAAHTLLQESLLGKVNLTDRSKAQAFHVAASIVNASSLGRR